MARTITEECHGVSRVSHPHPACRCARHAGSGFLPVSAASAGLLPGPFSRESTNRGGPTGPRQYVLETPDVPVTRRHRMLPTTQQRLVVIVSAFTMPLGAPSVLPRSRGFHPLGPPPPLLAQEQARSGARSTDDGLRRCRMAVPTLTTERQLTPGARARG